MILRYFLYRLLHAIPLMVFLLALTFILLRVTPGGPFDGDRVWPPEVKANIERKYGLDQPIPTQFAYWIADVLKGDLRESFQHVGKPVGEIIWESFPASFLLGGFSLFLALILGIPLGAISAQSKGSLLDSSCMVLAIAGVSLPSYLVATLFILFFSIYLGWLPPALWESPSSLILPIFTLMLRPMAMIARLTRSSLIEALQSDYVRTARLKRLSRFQVVYKHALRNSIIPVLALLGPLTANLITGSFVVETIFQIPGMGKHFVTAVLNRDYPLVMGTTLFYGVLLILSNIFVDVLMSWIDPRIQLHPASERSR